MMEDQKWQDNREKKPEPEKPKSELERLNEQIAIKEAKAKLIELDGILEKAEEIRAQVKAIEDAEVDINSKIQKANNVIFDYNRRMEEADIKSKELVEKAQIKANSILNAAEEKVEKEERERSNFAVLVGYHNERCHIEAGKCASRGQMKLSRYWMSLCRNYTDITPVQFDNIIERHNKTCIYYVSLKNRRSRYWASSILDYRSIKYPDWENTPPYMYEIGDPRNQLSKINFMGE